MSLPYALTEDPRKRLGLIALQVDETIEDDFRRMLPRASAKLHVTRVPSGAELTPESIHQMADDLPSAARLLPPAARFEVIAYGCTSGTSLIGADRVRDLVCKAANCAQVANPLTAIFAALEALSVSNVGIVSPYIASVGDGLRAAIQAGGVAVPQMLSFGEEIEARVARIDPSSIAEAAETLAARGGIEAVFLSCTNLRTLDLIPDLEDKLGLPVLASNPALAWHMARLADVPAQIPGRLGRL